MRDLVNNITPDAPCKECTDRYLGCHSSCEKYIEYKKKSVEATQKVLKQKSFERTFYAEQRKVYTKSLKKKK